MQYSRAYLECVACVMFKQTSSLFTHAVLINNLLTDRRVYWNLQGIQLVKLVYSLLIIKIWNLTVHDYSKITNLGDTAYAAVV